MNELTQNQNKQLFNKIQQDLKQGYKKLGNYVNQVDIIRVWCQNTNSQRTYAIVATSGKRFDNASSFLELQSFGTGCNYRVAFLMVNDELHETTISQTSAGSEYTIEGFVADFMLSKPDQELTRTKLAADGYNPKNVEWISTPK
jgi:hypothetical protein